MERYMKTIIRVGQDGKQHEVFFVCKETRNTGLVAMK